MKKINKFINLKQLLLLGIVFFLFFFSSLFQIIPIKLFHLKPTNGNKILLSCFSNLCLLLILILIYRKDLKSEFIKFKNNYMESLDIGLKYWLIGLAVMFFSNMFIIYGLRLGQSQNEQAVQKMISSFPIFMIINAGVIAPMIEELVFRKSFRNAFVNKWLFIIASGLIFGSLHVLSFNNPLELLYIIPYSSLGISFALMYTKTDTICTSIFMHMFHNTLLTIISIL